MQNLPERLLERQRRGGLWFQRQCIDSRLASLEISHEKRILSAHEGGLTWLDLDLVEQRYLLASASDTSVAAYDILGEPTGKPAGVAVAQHKPLFKLDRSVVGGHKYSVSCVTWYPVDTGLFVTGSYDHEVKVWDTNCLQVACSFALPVQVNGVAMSSCAAVHCLVAVGVRDPQVRLCDPGSGGVSHTLIGHRDSVWSLSWSLTSEWQLATGSCDGQVRLWDVRSSGCVHVFDQHDTQSGRRAAKRQRTRQAGAGLRQGWPAASQATAHEGSVTAVTASPDGLYWVTAGSDSRVRLWDSCTLKNKLVNYKQTFNRAGKARQIAIALDGSLLFHPSGSIVQAFDLVTGASRYVLKGHMDTINACAYNNSTQELYTGSNDCQIAVWGPQQDAGAKDEDTWST